MDGYLCIQCTSMVQAIAFECFDKISVLFLFKEPETLCRVTKTVSFCSLQESYHHFASYLIVIYNMFHTLALVIPVGRFPAPHSDHHLWLDYMTLVIASWLSRCSLSLPLAFIFALVSSVWHALCTLWGLCKLHKSRDLVCMVTAVF